MATNINYPNGCTLGSLNTGSLEGCVVKFGFVRGIIATFGDFEIPEASLTSIESVITYLQGKTLEANKLNRAYYIPFIQDLTDNTPDAELKKSGYGDDLGHVEQPLAWQFEFTDMGVEFHKNLRNFNDKQGLKVYVVTDNFIGGERSATGVKPFKASLFAKPVKVGKPTGDLNKYMGDLTIKNPKAMSDLLFPMVLPEDYDLESNLNGLVDVVLSATGGSGTISVTAKIKATGEDFITKYASEIASGSVILVDDSASTGSVSNGVYSITIAAGSHIVKLDTPIAISAEGVGSLTSGSYESNEVTVTVTA